MAFDVVGRVQGIGFRPYVFGLASRLGLGGIVQNDRLGVHIEVEGAAEVVEKFACALVDEAPPLADIDEVRRAPVEPLFEQEFRIETSRDGAGRGLAPDFATCQACLTELFDPSNRRFEHPFVSCTSCGPRLTITLGAPYDRARTTMAGFEMCAACRREYESPRDRRFHAQPIACPDCGPRLHTSVRSAADAILGGDIVAVKGLGGFHLACDATRAEVVERLRARKRRDMKPFAVMMRDVDEASLYCALTEAERELLLSPVRPVVVVAGRDRLPRALAPGLDTVGVVLPYTPVHHLLLRAIGRPLVMTSANVSGEPIVADDVDAPALLAAIADVTLDHDRTIAVACEDGVARVVDEEPVWLRRSRGASPDAVKLPNSLAQPTLAVGGHLKAVFGLGVGDRAILGPHFGDLDDVVAQRRWSSALAMFEETFGVRPERIVHDLHPDYEPTRYALERARAEGVALLAVQHHHAHMAACMAEHGLDGEVVAVCFDGLGLGRDGEAWGGEILVGGYARFERAHHVRELLLAGGDAAVREPWRIALAELRRAGRMVDLGIEPRRRDAVLRLLNDDVRCVRTSSMGRLFDAVAAIVVGVTHPTYEADGPCQLECWATRSSDAGAYDFDGLDPTPLVRDIVDDLARGARREDVARRFHNAVVRATTEACVAVARASGLDRVVLTGGVFANAILTADLPRSLEGVGLHAYRHVRVPPNDGGLALGQLAIAAATGAC